MLRRQRVVSPIDSDGEQEYGCATEKLSYCRRVEQLELAGCQLERPTASRLTPGPAGPRPAASVPGCFRGLLVLVQLSEALSLLAPSCVARLLSAVLIEFSQSDVYRRLLSALLLSSRASVSRLSLLVSPFSRRSGRTQVSHGGELAKGYAGIRTAGRGSCVLEQGTLHSRHGRWDARISRCRVCCIRACAA